MENISDFIYKDISRISSYYAQVFGGSITSYESSESTSETSEREVGGSIEILKGQIKKTYSMFDEAKKIIDPHDFLIIETLAFLKQNGFINNDITEAQNGQIVIENGTLFLIDKAIIAAGLESFHALQQFIPKEFGYESKSQQKEIGKFINSFKNLLPKVPFLPAFLFQTASKINIIGTVKEENLAEPISSFYFKHGSNGLSNVCVIGIKEIGDDKAKIQESPFLEMGGAVAQAFSQMVFPSNAIRLAPIVMFRKINKP
ncbi:MAG: hypothetical protein AB1546_12985 [bacterium]